MPTRTQARDLMHQHLDTYWSASTVTQGVTMFCDDVNPSDVPATAWARTSIQHNISPQRTLGELRIHETQGLLTVQVFTPIGDGQSQADAIGEVLQNAFRRVATDDGYCVRFRNAIMREAGDDGKFYQSNFVTEFRYDEVPQ